jgi:hypothetical protein
MKRLICAWIGHRWALYHMGEWRALWRCQRCERQTVTEVSLSRGRLTAPYPVP